MHFFIKRSLWAASRRRRCTKDYDFETSNSRHSSISIARQNAFSFVSSLAELCVDKHLQQFYGKSRAATVGEQRESVVSSAANTRALVVLGVATTRSRIWTIENAMRIELDLAEDAGVEWRWWWTSEVSVPSRDIKVLAISCLPNTKNSSSFFPSMKVGSFSQSLAANGGNDCSHSTSMTLTGNSRRLSVSIPLASIKAAVQRSAIPDGQVTTTAIHQKIFASISPARWSFHISH